LNEIRLAIFDCDGTLVDSQHSIIHCMNEAFERYDLDRPSRDAVRRVVGLPLIDAVAILAPEQGPERHEDLRTAYSDAWQELRKTDAIEEPLFPNVLETLDELERDGWLLAVATGKSRRGLDATLEKHGILGRFVSLQMADRVRGKPHPDMVLAALGDAGAEASRAAVIGDTTYDVLMAVNAGVRAIGVTWGYHEPDELMANGAVKVVDSFSEVPPLLAAMVGSES